MSSDVRWLVVRAAFHLGGPIFRPSPCDLTICRDLTSRQVIRTYRACGFRLLGCARLLECLGYRLGCLGKRANRLDDRVLELPPLVGRIEPLSEPGLLTRDLEGDIHRVAQRLQSGDHGPDIAVLLCRSNRLAEPFPY